MSALKNLESEGFLGFNVNEHRKKKTIEAHLDRYSIRSFLSSQIIIFPIFQQFLCIFYDLFFFVGVMMDKTKRF